jgi:hypothetical protein
MKRSTLVIALGVGLLLCRGAAAQEGAVINADGTAGTSTAATDAAVDADGPTVVYGDLDLGPGVNVVGPPAAAPAAAPAPAATVPGTTGNVSAADGNASAVGPGTSSAVPGTVTGGGSETSLLGPDGTYAVTDAPPSSVSVGDETALVPAPAPDPFAEEVAAAAVESAPVDGDLDGDNYPDAQELEAGLDPANIDTDGDGVADGDEVNIYGTDPLVWDTDGDGRSDGDELYNTRTDPLVWDGDGGGAADAGAGDVAADPTTEEPATPDGDGDRLADADEAALGTDPANPDTDGDGYYDGDEVNLGADPFDPSSFPTT